MNEGYMIDDAPAVFAARIPGHAAWWVRTPAPGEFEQHARLRSKMELLRAEQELWESQVKEEKHAQK